jgi:hypothetical protein
MLLLANLNSKIEKDIKQFWFWPGMQTSCLRLILKFYLEKHEQD